MSALNAVVKRHETLRTSFAEEDGSPLQVVSSNEPFPLRRHDLSDHSPGERDRELARVIRDEARSSFDLGRAPLARGHLLRLGPDDHYLLLNVHHIVFDGWSQGLLIRELSSLYRSAASGEMPKPPPLDVQYRDFAIAQRNALQNGSLSRHALYWKQKLTDLDPLTLPSDGERPSFFSYRGGEHWFSLGPILARTLPKLGTANRATLFMTLMAAFQAFLSTGSQQQDICVGTAFANRANVDFERVIGFFVNSLAIRTDLSGDPPFREVLSRVVATTLEAYEHRDLPFETVVQEVNPPRDPSRHPLFQVMLILHNLPPAALEFPGLHSEWHPIASNTSKFDLMLELLPMSEDIRARVRYNADLFEPVTINRFCKTFVRFLHNLVDTPGQCVSALARSASV